MTPPHPAYSAALMVAGLVCLVAGLLVLQTRRTASGSVPLTVFMFALSYWDLTYSLFWAGAPAPYPNFWLYITYVSAVIVPAAFMLFAMQLSGRAFWLKAPFILALCLEPLIVLIILFTDPWHGLFFAGKETQNIGMIMASGPVYWANIIYSYLLILIGFILLVNRFIQTSGIYRQQIVIVLVGTGLPWLSSFMFVFFGFTPFPNADHTPLLFTIAGLAFTYALLRYRLLDIMPIARHVLIESMGDGVLVLDTRNRLVDLNPTAKQTLGSPEGSMIGEFAENVFSPWVDIAEAFYEVKDVRTEVPIGDPPGAYLDLRISPLYDDNRNFIGRLVVWRDITPLKKAQIELQEQATRDPLTGIYNRRYLNEVLKRELARAEREECPVTLVMMDIDHFKDVNDIFGHSTGDWILQRFAAQLINQTRVGDIVCRYGGEEFLVLLPNSTAEIAYPIAERWRRSFQEIQLSQGGLKANATISCGIAEFPKHANSGEGLISTADKAMYYAKAAGRNRVAIWQGVSKAGRQDA